MNINSNHGLKFCFVYQHDTITFDSYHMSAFKHRRKLSAVSNIIKLLNLGFPRVCLAE